MSRFSFVFLGSFWNFNSSHKLLSSSFGSQISYVYMAHFKDTSRSHPIREMMQWIVWPSDHVICHHVTISHHVWQCKWKNAEELVLSTERMRRRQMNSFPFTPAATCCWPQALLPASESFLLCRVVFLSDLSLVISPLRFPAIFQVRMTSRSHSGSFLRLTFYTHHSAHDFFCRVSSQS